MVKQEFSTLHSWSLHNNNRPFSTVYRKLTSQWTKSLHHSGQKVYIIVGRNFKQWTKSLYYNEHHIQYNAYGDTGEKIKNFFLGRFYLCHCSYLEVGY